MTGNVTTSSDQWVTVRAAVCLCCVSHPNEVLMGWVVVTCPTCGLPCSCEGCIADADHERQER